jgi:hypothetical protein
MLQHERLRAAACCEWAKACRRRTGVRFAALSVPPLRASPPQQLKREVERHLAISTLGDRLGPTVCDRSASAVYVRWVIARSGLVSTWRMEMGDGWLRFGQGCSYPERGFVRLCSSSQTRFVRETIQEFQQSRALKFSIASSAQLLSDARSVRLVRRGAPVEWYRWN